MWLQVLSGADLVIFGSLDVAENTSTATGTVTVDGTGSTLTQNGPVAINVGSASGGAGTINVTGSGTFNSGTGAIAVGTTGAINIDTGGTFNANGTMTVDGGSLTRAAGNLDLTGGLTLTATNDAQIDFTGDYDIDAGTTFDLQSGADLSVSNFLDIGSDLAGGGGDGTLIVDGVGTTVTANTIAGPGRHLWGWGGHTADITFRNDAQGDFGNIGLADETTADTTGVFRVQSGATVTTGDLAVATAGGTTTSGAIDFDIGSGSLIQTGASTLTLGHASEGSATIDLGDFSTFESGTGNITVNATGSINLGIAAQFVANGDVHFNGGTLTSASLFDGQDFILAPGRMLTATNDAQIDFVGGAAYHINQGTTFLIESGADLTKSGFLGIGGFLAAGGGDGTLVVDGSGTSVSAALTAVGTDGFAGEVTIRSSATGDFSDVVLSSVSTFNVESAATVTSESLFLATGAGSTTGTINVDGAGSSFTQDGASNLTVGHASNGTATLNVTGDGTVSSGTGSITINPTGAINIDTGGTFNANGTMTVDGGSLTRAAGNFDLASGLTLTASNDAQIDFTGDYDIDAGTTFDIGSGADLTVSSFFDIGSDLAGGGGDGTLIVDGLGTSVTANSNVGGHQWGWGGHTADITFRNEAQGDFGVIGLANEATAGTTAILRVESSATVTTGDLVVATAGGTTTSATIEVGTGHLIQTGASTLTVGHATEGSAAINLNSIGDFVSGTGNITVNPTGSINLSFFSRFEANGDVHLNGGSLTTNSAITGADFILAAGRTLTASNNAQIDFVGTSSYRINQGTTFLIESGADMTKFGILGIGGFLAPGPGGDGTLTVDGAGTSVTAGQTIVGVDGFTGDVTVRNDATGDFNDVQLANLGDDFSIGKINVETSATVTTENLSLAAGGGNTMGTLNVVGTGSTLSQNGASTLTMGHATEGTATLNVTGDGTFNSGTGAISVNSTGTINIGTGATGGTFNSDGPMTVDGTVNLLDGALNAGTITLNGGGAFNFTGGVLSVDSFVGNLDNQGGTLAPGGSPGITNVTGDYTNQSAATVQIEIDSPGGLPGTDFDRVNITAAANLDGALFADVGYVPAHQDSVQVMTFASRSGVFSAVTDSGLAGNLVMAPFYTATDLTLSAELLGDASGDGSVGPEDYTLWADAFGIAEPSYDDGDLSRNGVVGPEDYTIWADNFGLIAAAPGDSPAAVPEPSSLALLMIAAVVIAGPRPRQIVSITRRA